MCENIIFFTRIGISSCPEFSCPTLHHPDRRGLFLDVVVSERGAAAADGAAGAEVTAAAEAALAEAADRGAAEAAEAVEDAQRHHPHHGQHDQREIVLEPLLGLLESVVRLA